MTELPGTRAVRELLEQALERERGLQRELMGQVFRPVDAVFDLLEQSAGALRQQAEALQQAAAALEQAAGMMKVQAELFERATRTARQPAELAKAVTGHPRRTRKPSK